VRAVKLRVAEVSGFPWPPFSRAIAHARPQEAIPRGPLAPALTWTLASDDGSLESFASEDRPTRAFQFRQAGTGGEPELPRPKREGTAKAAFYTLLGVLLIESLYIASHFPGKRARRDEPKPELAARTIGALMTPGLPASAIQAGERDRPPIAPVETRSATSSAVATSLRREPAATVAQNPPSEPAQIDPPGWVSIDLPIQVQIFERGRFVGTNDAGRVAMASGLHELELVNESLQLRVKQTVYIRSDQTTPLPIELPSGTLNVNALPWSDVVVDGRSLGATPLGHVRLPIGAHHILFRHPQLGEQVWTAVVRAGAETRVTVDFRK
jgi:hypothetical protein